MSEREKVTVLVPRIVDELNVNAQNLNAKAMLARFSSPDVTWVASHYHAPAEQVANAAHVRLTKLWRWRFWRARLFLLYQQRADAIFYPGVDPVDRSALNWRRRLKRRVPVIATLEGLMGDSAREQLLNEWAGHKFFCQPTDTTALARIDAVLEQADHIIAITPFLARAGRRLYGDRVSTLSLGVDRRIFHPQGRSWPERPRIIAAGSHQARKRPEFFLQLARRFPGADFVWFGEGELRPHVVTEARRMNLSNLSFPGAARPEQIADEFRRSSLFLLPSNSEGSPKAAQEAAACGLPLVLFGFYEPHSLAHGENGYLVWNDEECCARVEELLANPDRLRQFGQRSAEMAREWDWDRLAPLWEERILQVIGGG